MLLLSSSRWLHRQPKPHPHHFHAWEGLGAAPPTPLSRCPPVLLPPPPAAETTHPLMCALASTTTVTVGSVLYLCVYTSSCTHSCAPPSDGSQSGAQYPPRAEEAVWTQWQGQQQAQNNAEQQPHPQGNQQDMFPVSDTGFRISPDRCSYFFLLK